MMDSKEIRDSDRSRDAAPRQAHDGVSRQAPEAAPGQAPETVPRQAHHSLSETIDPARTQQQLSAASLAGRF